MSSYVNCLGGRCPHMPFFIGGHMSGGGGGCPTLGSLDMLVLRFEFQKFRILKFFELSPM